MAIDIEDENDPRAFSDFVKPAHVDDDGTSLSDLIDGPPGENPGPPENVTDIKSAPRRGRPRKEQGTKVKAEKPAPPMPPGQGYKPGIEKTYQIMGMGLMPFDPEVGAKVIEIAPQAAEAINNLARTNPALRRLIENLTKTTAAGAVIAAHMPLIMLLMERRMMTPEERAEKAWRVDNIRPNGFDAAGD